MPTYSSNLATLSGTVTVPDAPTYPERFVEEFDNGIGYWIAQSGVGGPREVVNGVFRSWGWGADDNHLTAYGGAGRLRLLAYADYPLWNYQKPDSTWVTSNFTNALVSVRVRGVGFSANGSEWILWIQCRHPSVPGKFVNWGYVGEPRTAALTSGNWTDVSWRLDPDPTKWVWGKGQNSYDTFLSLPESLQNIFNIHFPTLGADNSSSPSGTFEMERCEIQFNRNAPPQSVSPDGVVVFDPPLDTASSGNSGSSIRGISSPITAGGTQIRVTFKSPSGGGAAATHVAIGKQASTYSTVSTPVELKFGGASGFVMSAGGQITSDWATLTTAVNDVLVIVIDSDSSTQIRTSGTYAGGAYIKPSSSSYNAASPSGFTDHFTQYFGGKIEVK